MVYSLEERTKKDLLAYIDDLVRVTEVQRELIEAIRTALKDTPIHDDLWLE